MITIFTGLVEEIGEVASIENGKNSLKIKIRCKEVIKGEKLGASIATNGTCLTAVEISDDYFIADCMHETVNRTNLRRLKIGDKVDLERSLTLSTPLGGHLVTGDVDTEGEIVNISQDGIAKIYEIKVDKKYMKYIVEKGRITVDGASLTVMGLTDDTFSVSLIPHTQEKIILGSRKKGDHVNIETDLIGKYVEKMLGLSDSDKDKKTEITAEFLMKNGF